MRSILGMPSDDMPPNGCEGAIQEEDRCYQSQLQCS